MFFRLFALATAILFSLLTVRLEGQVSLSGQVKNRVTGEALAGASVYVVAMKTGTTTNRLGQWKLSLPSKPQTLIASHLGYRSDTIFLLPTDSGINITSDADHSLRSAVIFYLTPDTTAIPAASVIGQANSLKFTKMHPGQIRLSAPDLARIPSLMGEQDPLNALRSLPGIQSVGEGSGYFFVRGGNADQNLILLDEAVLFNPSHLLGIFSVINPSVIQSVSVFKGGIPAFYGDRLASVIDLTTRDGCFQKFTGEASVGLIASRITAEGPIVKDRISLMIALRRTQLDLLTPFLLPASSPFHGSGYSFFDLNGKISWKISEKNQFFLSGYMGNDQFRLKDEEIILKNRMGWGNRALSANNILNVNNNLSLKSTIAWSGYALDFAQDYHDYYIGLKSGLGSLRIRQEADIRPTDSHRIQAGFEWQEYRFLSYQADIRTGKENLNIGDPLPYKAREAAWFIHHEWLPLSVLSIHTGIRLMNFQHRGPFQRFVNNAQGFPADTVFYPEGTTLASFLRFEPRFSASWQMIPGFTLKASASRQYQPIHMVPLSTATLPLDLWIPSTSLITPQKGTSFSLGLYPDIGLDVFEGYIEGFFRTMTGQLEFMESLTLLGLVRDNLDRHVVKGQGKAYGLEVFLRKRTGKTQGWIGYTWSHVWRIFPEINQGKPFHPRHDRTHDINVFITTALNSHWDGSLQFVYATGQPVTVPLSVYLLNGTVVQEFSERNVYRLPPYHRIDLSFTRKPLSPNN